MAVMAPFAGRISDKVEPLRVSMVGMGISFLALVYFVFLNDSSPLWFTLVGLVILGFGFGMFASPAANAVMSSVDKKYFGVASGSQAAMRHIGQVVSMAIVMILFAVYIGDVQITPEYYPEFLASLKTSFIIFAILCFGGIFVLLAGGRLRQSKLDKTVPGNPLK
jgi:MFS family permease